MRSAHQPIANMKLRALYLLALLPWVPAIAMAYEYQAKTLNGETCGFDIPAYPAKALRNVRWSGRCNGDGVMGSGVLMFTLKGEITAQWGHWEDSKPSGVHVMLGQGSLPLGFVVYSKPGVYSGMEFFPTVQVPKGQSLDNLLARVQSGYTLKKDDITTQVTYWSRRPGMTPAEVFSSAPVQAPHRGEPVCCAMPNLPDVKKTSGQGAAGSND